MPRNASLDCIEAVDAGILAVDAQTGVIVFANAKVVELLGRAREDLVGRRCATLEALVRAAPAGEGDPGFDLAPRELSLKAADGRTLPVYLSAKTLETPQGRLALFTFTDIAPLREARERYQAFFDNAVEGVFQSSLDGRFLRVNPALAEILGYDGPKDLVDSVVDLRSQLYVDPADRDRLLEALDRHGRVTNLETRFKRKDGTVKWISQAARIVRSESGEPLAIEGLNIDITAKKEAEAALLRAKARLKELVTSSPAVIYARSLDSGHDLTFLSDNSEDLTGFSPSAFLKVPGFWRSRLHPDEGASVVAQYAQWVAEGEGSLDYRFKDAAGDYRVVRDQFHIVRGAEGGPAEIVGYLTDVTAKYVFKQALQSSENRYQAIVEDQTELVCRFRPGGALTYVNEAFALYFGRTKGQLLGERYMALFPPNCRDALEAHLDSLNADQPVAPIEHRLVMPDASVRWLQCIDRALFDAAGALVEYQSVARDVTGRILTEQSLRRVQEEKERLRLNLEAVFRSIPDAIVVVDTDMRVLQTNRALAEICCIGGDFSRGRALKLVAGHCRRACFEALATTLRTRQPVSEYRVECHGQSPGKTLVINSSPLLDSDHAFVGAVLIIRDITHLADLEKRLTDQQGRQGIIGKSKGMRQIYAVIEQLCEVESTVLIGGESGTGKELVAEALHFGGPRGKGPLIKVNCSALSESLLESELFGHVRGAFTGAIRDKLGRFEAAEGGTIFLDEIGDISPRIQLNLLRVLERKEFERVGDSRTRQANVRVLAATNVDLREKIRQGAFRADLYYRLKVMVINLPPLRERSEDIPLLVEHFLAQFRSSFGKSITRLSDEVTRIFMTHHWPGNVRELKYALEHACILCTGNEIRPEHLPLELTRVSAPPRLPREGLPPLVVLGPSRGLSRETILEALARTAGNKAKAARMLGVDRRTLYRNLAKHALG